MFSDHSNWSLSGFKFQRNVTEVFWSLADHLNFGTLVDGYFLFNVQSLLWSRRILSKEGNSK